MYKSLKKFLHSFNRFLSVLFTGNDYSQFLILAHYFPLLKLLPTNEFFLSLVVNTVTC